MREILRGCSGDSERALAFGSVPFASARQTQRIHKRKWKVVVYTSTPVLVLLSRSKHMQAIFHHRAAHSPFLLSY